VGAFLAEHGAEVVKVENPSGGDPTRQWLTAAEDGSSLSSYFTSANFGKKSVTVDLMSDEGRAKADKLVRWCDVLLVNHKPGDEKKLDFGSDRLLQLNPSLIIGKIRGYPSVESDEKEEEALFCSRPGFDAVVQAESGHMMLNGERDGPPTKYPVALMDVAAAHQLKEAILLALIDKWRGGENRGVEITVSLFDSALSSLANQASSYLTTGVVPERMGSEHPSIVPYGSIYYDRDNEPLVLAVGTDKQFASLCRVLKQDGLAEQYPTGHERVQNRRDVHAKLQQNICHFSVDDLLPLLWKSSVPAGRVATVETALALAAAEGLKLKDERSGGGAVRQAVAEWRYAQSSHQAENGHISAEPLLPPPALGEHDEEIEASLLSK